MSVNKIIIMGALGKDPEQRSFANGGGVVSFSVATSDKWKDKASGESKEKTQWHRVAIFNEQIGKVAMDYLKKGSKVHITGQIESRKYTDSAGVEREITEVVLPRYRGELVIVESKKAEQQPERKPAPAKQSSGSDPYEDDIPF